MSEVQIPNLNNDISKEEKIDDFHDYEDQMIQEESKKIVTIVLKYVFIICGIIIIFLLLNISNILRNLFPPLGYISFIVTTILFIWIYIRPILFLYKTDHFDINNKNRDKAESHNAKLRKKVAKGIIEFHKKYKSVEWYDIELINKLEEALNKKNEYMIGKYTFDLMDTSIKKTSNKLIKKSAVQSGIYAAVSPYPHLDALLVLSVNIKMVKDIIFLYGFRPTGGRLCKTIFKVGFSALTAYHLDSAEIAEFISSKILVRGLPIIKEAASFATDAAIQAITNASLTMLIGYKTVNYLHTEYGIQDAYKKYGEIKEVKMPNDDNTKDSILRQIAESVPFIKNSIYKIKMLKEVTNY